MRRVLAQLLLAIPLIVLGCAKQLESPPAPAGMAGSVGPPAPVPVQAQAALVPVAQTSAVPGPAQGMFDHHCGECHRSDRETAKPKALAIFDLTHEGWLAGMTASQVKGAVMRVKGSSKANEGERSAALSLLDAELARRGAGVP